MIVRNRNFAWLASAKRLFQVSLLVGVLFCSACSKELSDCPGPELPLGQLEALRSGSGEANGPLANLVIPNPLDAEGSSQVFASGGGVLDLARGLSLPGLASGGVLQNDFLRVRRNTIEDPVSELARPNSAGNFAFPFQDIRYSEALAYYSVTSIQRYVETLGFPPVKTRPLFVLVESQEEGQDPNEINAFYEHNYLNPESPRIMRLIGGGTYATAKDRDMFWHEYGHLHNESITAERKFDGAGDQGAFYTDGAALHECIADYLAQSVGDKNFIGRWIAKNFPEIPNGQPLRWAVDTAGNVKNWNEVARADGSGVSPERYNVAEWCTRVLWEVRQKIVAEAPTTGAIYSDRLVFSAMSLLKRDASMQDFSQALLNADKQLHCGIHEGQIRDAFEDRGFKLEPDSLGKPISVQAAPLGLVFNGGSLQVGNPTPGEEATFEMILTNPNSSTARNVRVRLRAISQGFFPTTYMQGYGNLAAGQELRIGTEGGRAVPLDSSVFGLIDQRMPRGSRIRVQLEVLMDNGPSTVQEATIQL